MLDNGSADDSRQRVRERFPEVRLMALPVNIGFSGAANVVIRETRAPYVMLVNPDGCWIPGSWPSWWASPWRDPTSAA